MANYKYYIKQRGDRYYFGLYPNNSNSQAIAISGEYATYKDAQEAIRKLQSLLRSSKNLFNEKEDEKGYSFELKQNKENLVFFREGPFTHHYEVQKGINRIYKNYDAPIKFFDE